MREIQQRELRRLRTGLGYVCGVLPRGTSKEIRGSLEGNTNADGTRSTNRSYFVFGRLILIAIKSEDDLDQL
jgi:hypothetical protein